MTTTIGRCGLDIVLGEVDEWVEQHDGTVRTGGWLEGATAAEAAHLRDQFIGAAADEDEPVVPVTLGHDDSRNGWYEVLGGGVEHVLGMTEVTGDRRWTAALRRVAAWDQPMQEIDRRGGIVTNNHSITPLSYSGFLAVPNSAKAIELDPAGTWLRGLRTADTGGIAFITGGGTVLYDDEIGVQVPLADHYDGASTLQVDLGSSVYKTIVGRNVRAEHVTDWRLDNGNIRVDWSTASHGLRFELFNGTSWTPFDFPAQGNPAFILTDDSSSTVVAEDPVAWRVLRNDPTVVTIRLKFDYESSTSWYLWDITLRRGDRNVICVVKGPSRQWGLEQSGGAYASTNITGASRCDANDSNGHRWLICSPRTFTLNTSVGVLYLSSASPVFPFGIGVEVGGSSATLQAAADKVRLQYYAQPFEAVLLAGI